MSKIVYLFLFLSLSVWANIGNIMVIKGSAEVQRSSGNVSATMGMIILEGDTIITIEKSRVQVMLKDDTVITIGPSSRFSFDEFSFDGTPNSKLQMSATRGFFRSVTGKLGKVAPNRFKVKTANATIGIRGTDLSADIHGKNETIRCHSGAITVEYEGSVNNVDAGMMLVIRPDAAPVIKEIPKAKPSDEAKESNKESSKSDEESSDDAANGSEENLGFKGVVESEIESVDIPTEDIADVTQVEESIKQLPIEPEPVEPTEPFEITPSTEDREVRY